MAGAADSQAQATVAAVRRFTRFYTQKVGVLQEGLLDSPFTLAQARVLYELANRPPPVTAAKLGEDLGLDAGYLSRILREFHAGGLLRKETARDDGRRVHLCLTGKGRKAFAPLDRASRREISALLKGLGPSEQTELTRSMRKIEHLLGNIQTVSKSYSLRSPKPGDMGWVVMRHGALYAQEYRWNASFEALVAEIVAQFVQKFDAERERCWIAECEGESVGSVFLVKHTPTIAKLRLLLVEPQARGMGIGARLVDECLRFARERGYRKMMLWTNDVLTGARRIYERAGLTCVKREPHHSFGHDLVGETWECKL